MNAAEMKKGYYVGNAKKWASLTEEEKVAMLRYFRSERWRIGDILALGIPEHEVLALMNKARVL